ncbi:MAG: hypothetical protein Q9163_001384 [Psora crenata]
MMTDERSDSAIHNIGQIPPSSSESIRKVLSTTVDHQGLIPPAGAADQSFDLSPEAISSRLRKPAPSNIDTWQGDSPSQICLCQPDPKVPRPRNAFILYRQHHQASVIAQHPGLANPEISKVIGDHWRASPSEVKEHWKLLAEEEKIRHQRQYPDYRYQPRRSGRPNSFSNSTSSASSSVAEGARRCPKCGGKSISSSSMMSTSIPMSNQASPNPSHPHGRDGREAIHAPMLPPSAFSSISTARHMRGLGSPPVQETLPQGMHQFARAQTAHTLSLTSPHYTKRGPEISETSPNSPDTKRRRVTNVSFIPPARGPQGPQTPFAPHQRRPSLPRPDFMGAPMQNPLGPPSSRRLTSGHPSQRRDSLKLPPLYTGNDNVSGHKRSLSIETQTKSLEAMIHSIPLLNKIRVLGRISAPLPLMPAPTSPVGFGRRKGRGIVIAVDSADSAALKQLTQTLERTLMGEYDLKVFTVPEPPGEESQPPSFQSYLRLVEGYHSLSAQVVAHVAPPDAFLFPPSALPAEEEVVTRESLSPVSPKSFPREKLPLRTTKMTIEESPAKASTGPDDDDHHRHRKLPLAVLPCWQLTHTDAFATTVPISDSYSPTDHWQWGATVWRGVVGADVTIAVRPEMAPEEHVSPPGTAGSAEIKGSSNEGGKCWTGNGTAAVAATMPKEKPGASGVEIRLEGERAMLVKAETGGGVNEGALRRVGFEIGEWVRAWEMMDVE